MLVNNFEELDGVSVREAGMLARSWARVHEDKRPSSHRYDNLADRHNNSKGIAIGKRIYRRILWGVAARNQIVKATRRKKLKIWFDNRSSGSRDDTMRYTKKTDVPRRICRISSQC